MALTTHSAFGEIVQRPQNEETTESVEIEALIMYAIERRTVGKDSEALAALLQALALAPESIRVQAHLATAYQALGDWLRADDYLSSVLRQAEHPYVVRQRGVLAEARQRIDSHVGHLSIVGQPAGAELWLGGRRVGALPLKEPLRVVAGTYRLEVRHPGYYDVVRRIDVIGGHQSREVVRLEAASVPMPNPEPRATPPERQTWLTWTLTGLGAATAATGLGALGYRELSARRWNSTSRCLAPGRTRLEVCGSERQAIQTAEQVALASGIMTLSFASAAILNIFVFDAESSQASGVSASGCGVAPGWLGAGCHGWF